MKNKFLVLLMTLVSTSAFAESVRVVSCWDEYFTVNVHRGDDGRLMGILTRNASIDGHVRSTSYAISKNSSGKFYQGTHPKDVRFYIRLGVKGDSSTLEVTYPDVYSRNGVGKLTRGLGEGGRLSCK